ncbi:MAG: PHP domain-containing protein, partial [Desulfobulbaceae bacterium]|nr:PHP domain-containing protein [Desulfobulbaceae bacterium]
MIPLALHSHYSLLRGTASPRELCRAARTLGYTSLALTDINNLYGLWYFLAACREHEITPIIGAEIRDHPNTPRRAFALVENDTGYRNLCRLLTARHLDPAFQLSNALSIHGQGLILL